jgi:hypothetical protein
MNPVRRTLASGAPAKRTATAFAMVLPQQPRLLMGFDGSVDADGRRGFGVKLTVVTDNHPLTISPLHDLRMVNFPHAPDFPSLADVVAESDPSHHLRRDSRPDGRPRSYATITRTRGTGPGMHPGGDPCSTLQR